MEIITENGERFDVTAGYSFDLEFINPLLSDVGSQSAPGTLPYTPRNLRLLGFPDRIDNVFRPRPKRPVIIREGAFQKPASQVLMKATVKDKIVTTFYLDEAIFYEKIKTINMTEVNYGTPRKMTVRQLFNLCEDVMFLRRTDDFHLFPVISNYDVSDGEVVKNNVILNKVAFNRATFTASLLDQSLYGITVDDTPVSVPFGYGVSPFLKVSFILRKVIEHLGYALENNVFEIDVDLRQLVLVNNVADAIVKGELNYAQLVPTCTVSDFIKTLRDKFGVCFIVNEVAKTITLAFLRDKLTAAPDLDLTPFATAPPSIEWGQPQRMHLSAETSITGAAPAVESVDDLVRRYGPINFIATSGTKLSWPFNALYFVRAENVFLVKERTGTGQIPKFLRFSPLFDFTTPGEGDLVDTASLDEQLPLFAAYYYDPESKEEHRYILPGVMETALVNSTLTYSDSDKEQTEAKRDTPIMFCFSLPRLQQQLAPLPAGTTAAYDWSGSGWSNVSLNIAYDHALAGLYYAPYSHFLSYSNFAVNCLLRLPLSRLQTLDLSTPKLLFNQPILVERIKCRIGTGIFEITETIFRTLKSYEDA